MGYRLVQAVLVVTLGRLGDMFGRVKIYNAGFAVFTVASILLSFDPFLGGTGCAVADRLAGTAGHRRLHADGELGRDPHRRVPARAARLRARHQPGRRASPASSSAWSLAGCWRPSTGARSSGSTCRSASSARSGRTASCVTTASGTRGRIDWWGNVTFALGLGAVLVALTNGIQPYGHHTMGWTNPAVTALLARRASLLLVAFVVIETRVAEPMFQLSLFRIRAFTAGNVAGLAVAIARGGLQFMLIIWLQGIWLPLHGYDFSDTPLWAGIFLLPLTAGILDLRAGVGRAVRPLRRSRLRDRRDGGLRRELRRPAAPAGRLPLLGVRAADAANGIGGGMFAAPNSASIMSSVPARHRGAASGMRSTYQNSGTALSIGVFFSLMIAGLASTPAADADAGPPGARRAAVRRAPDRRRCRRCRRCSPPSSA